MATTTQFVDAKTRDLGDEAARRAGHPDAAAAARWSSRARCSGRLKARRVRRRSRARRSSRRRVTTPDRPSRRSWPAAAPRSSAPARGRCSGTELHAPVITPRARDLNFTNEGGVCGTTRLLKNIGGLWLLQACRRSWAAPGLRLRIRDAARRPRATSAHAFQSLVRSRPPRVLSAAPTWSTAIADYCRQTGQPVPGIAGRVRARDPREPRVQVPRGARIARGDDRQPLRARSGSSAAARATAC